MTSFQPNYLTPWRLSNQNRPSNQFFKILSTFDFIRHKFISRRLAAPKSQCHSLRKECQSFWRAFQSKRPLLISLFFLQEYHDKDVRVDLTQMQIIQKNNSNIHALYGDYCAIVPLTIHCSHTHHAALALASLGGFANLPSQILTGGYFWLAFGPRDLCEVCWDGSNQIILQAHIQDLLVKSRERECSIPHSGHNHINRPLTPFAHQFIHHPICCYLYSVICKYGPT